MQEFSSMRPILTSLLCGASILAAACSSNEGESSNATSNASGGQPPAGAMTVDPLRIVSEPGNIRLLHATFSIRPARPNEPYMAPATVGGACLIAKVPVEGKSCAKASDCDITAPGQPKWTGYCLGADNLPVTTQGGSCWIKLSDQKNCLKPVGPGDHATPAMDVSAAYDYVAQQSPGQRRPIDWLILGCLNGTFGAPPPPCATGNGPHIHRAGQVRPVP
jgi:hypothetical protein